MVIVIKFFVDMKKIIFYIYYVIVKMKLVGYDLFGLNELFMVR